LLKSWAAKSVKSSPKIEAAYFDLAGASAYLGGALSVKRLRALIKQPGGIPHIRAGRGKILISRADLDAWLAARRRVPVDLDKVADELVAGLNHVG
jgi:excisionase family DNA binding protein